MGLTVLSFLLPAASGALLTHLLWPNREFWYIGLKLFLGAGIGLGLRSLLYFAYLLIFAGKSWFVVVDVVVCVALLVLVLRQNVIRSRLGKEIPRVPRLSGRQTAYAAIGGLVFLISLLSTASYLLRRQQGDWDAWMMYNRAARFVYLDQVNWLESFSPKMDPIFHADYPLLLAMNIAAGWDAVGRDYVAVPMLQSALFSVACVGLLTCSLGASRSVGQAALGLVIAWGIPVFVNEGAREMADVPLAFFILATGILVYLFTLHNKPGLLVLAGMTAGLAAWTKNEGSALIIGSFVAVVIVHAGRSPWRSLRWYALGLCFPLIVVLYFKLFLAPPSDVLSSGIVRSIQQALDLSRHLVIIRDFSNEILNFGSWGIGQLSVGILPILLVYYLIFRYPIPLEQQRAQLAGYAVLGIQILGYYAAFLITPYELEWHLSFSITRLTVQVFPLLLFLVLNAGTTVEAAFQTNAGGINGVNHASRR